MTMDPVETVRTVEDLWNTNRIDELDAYFAEDFAPHSGMPMLPPGLAGAKMAHQGSLVAFPDRNVEILDIFASEKGDKVCVRCRITGTNLGGMPFLGAPTGDGKKIDFEFIGIYELRDGKIVDHWGVNDALTGAMQLGGFAPAM
jgi:predicted ester cyclase